MPFYNFLLDDNDNNKVFTTAPNNNSIKTPSNTISKPRVRSLKDDNFLVAPSNTVPRLKSRSLKDITRLSNINIVRFKKTNKIKYKKANIRKVKNQK